MYFYTYEELIEFLNDFDSHWAHGSDLLREGCRPSNWREVLGKDYEEVNQELHDRQIIIEEELPRAWETLDKLKFYEKGLRDTHQELNLILDQFLRWKNDEDASPFFWHLLNCAPFNRLKFQQNPVVENQPLLMEHWYHEGRVVENKRLIPFLANMFYVTPDYGNYYLTFLNVLTTPLLSEGATRLERCGICSCAMLQKRQTQRFCSSKCRSKYHNSQKDSKKHAAYMREWRKKLKFQDARLRRQLSKARKWS